jgi:cyclohexanone monooxygenase
MISPTERPASGAAAVRAYDVVIVGAGFAGLYMLYRVRQLGLSVRVLEAGSGIGGVWFFNRYPGARCDVESVDYSYSFDEELQQQWSWTERYASQPEILSYVEHVADRFDLRRDVELGVRVERAVFDEDEARWTLTAGDGRRYAARWCVMATGGLSALRMPDYPGLDDFAGEWHHTAAWPAEPVDVRGRRVGVLGTGSSGTQVIPVIAREAAEVVVFQRTPNFTVPAQHEPMDPGYERSVKENYAARRARARETTSGLNTDTSRQAAADLGPRERERVFEDAWRTAGFGFILCFSDLLLDRAANDAAVEFISGKIREQVRDPHVADLLTPKDHPFGTKRPCVASDFYEAFNRDNVSLVDTRATPIERFTRDGVQTANSEHRLDVLVLATGFHAVTGALEQIDIIGRDGQSLSDAWSQGPRTYLGIAVAGFPNLFTLTGPGSPGILSNVMASLEQHVEWLADLLRHATERGVVTVEPEVAAQGAWVDHVNALADATLYPEADSYYLTDCDDGPRVFLPYPGGLRRYRHKAAKVAEDGYAGFSLAPARELA